MFPSPCLVVLVGPAGAGKTTWADATFGTGRVVSSDRLRALVGAGEDDLDASTDAFAMLEEVLRRRLARSLTTVVDTLGFDPMLRARCRNLAAATGIACVCVVFDTPAAMCRTRNAARKKRVPARALEQQLKTFGEVRELLADEGFAGVVTITAQLPSPIAAPPQTSAQDAWRGVRGTRPAPQPVAQAAVRPVVEGAPTPARLRFGLVLSSFAWQGSLPDRLRAVASEAEAVGFDSIRVMDHLRQIPQVGRAWDPMPEAFTLLSWLAAATDRIRLGPLVASVALRPIGLLAQMMAALDVLSNGRAECGLGAGWFEAEYRALGIPFPALGARYALLEDALMALPLLWGPGTKSFEGSTMRMTQAMCYPRPVQARIPILVGGGGERRTLALAARYADACNLRGSPEVIARKIAVLHEHCREAGRDPSEVAVTVLTDAVLDAPHGPVVERLRPRRVPAERWADQVGAGTVEQQVARCEGLVALGVSEVMIGFPELAATGDPSVLGHFAEVIAAFR